MRSEARDRWQVQGRHAAHHGHHAGHRACTPTGEHSQGTLVLQAAQGLQQLRERRGDLREGRAGGGAAVLVHPCHPEHSGIRPTLALHRPLQQTVSVSRLKLVIVAEHLHQVGAHPAVIRANLVAKQGGRPRGEAVQGDLDAAHRQLVNQGLIHSPLATGQGDVDISSGHGLLRTRVQPWAHVDAQTQVLRCLLPHQLRNCLADRNSNGLLAVGLGVGLVGGVKTLKVEGSLKGNRDRTSQLVSYAQQLRVIRKVDDKVSASLGGPGSSSTALFPRVHG